MITAGVDLHTVESVLVHKSAVNTERYEHLATDDLRDALGKIGTFPRHKEKEGCVIARNPLILLVGCARLELATNGLKVRCSTD